MYRRKFLHDITLSLSSFLTWPYPVLLNPVPKVMDNNEFVKANTAFGQLRGVRTQGVKILREFPMREKYQGKGDFEDQDLSSHGRE